MNYPETKDIKIPDYIIEKWQKIVDIVAEQIEVEAALIMKIIPPYIEVFRTSKTRNNPYKVGDREHLAGLYCETVIKKDKKLKIPNAHKEEKWKNNPDIELGMISYLGFPLKWPDGDFFGTICVLDSKEKEFNSIKEELLKHFKELIESHLKIIYQNNKLQKEIKKRNKLQKLLKENNKQLSITLQSIGDAVITTDNNCCITRINHKAEKLTGWKFNQARGLHLNKIFKIKNGDTGKPVENPVEKVLKSGKTEGLANNTVLVSKKGKEYQISDSASPIKDNHNNTYGVVLIFRNITEKYKMQQKIKKENRWLESLFKNATYPITLVDNNHRILDINKSFQEVFKYNLQDIKGKDLDSIMNMSREKSADKNLTKKLLQGQIVEIEATRYDKYGNPVECIIRGIPVMIDGKLIGAYGIYIDITERKKQEKKIKYLSFHDSLTDLYNRTYLEEEIKRIDVKRQLPISLIMADLNGLKIINDSYGHSLGDQLLIKTAEILTESCREEDLVARWGGDEFVVLLPQTSSQQVKNICKRINQNCNKSKIKEIEDDIPVSIALGYAVKEKSATDIFEVLKMAEDRMYNNKLTESRSVKSHIAKTLLKTLQEKSPETEEHAQRMKDLALKLGKKINLTQIELDKLALLASLHDIGKTIISEEILNKPGILTDSEWEIIKEHPNTGFRICSSTEDFSHIALELLSHHENWDGSGYPRGLKKEETPLLSRIIRIVDAYDVMTNDRPYKKALSQKEAIDELKRCASSYFDPQLLNVFIDIIKSE